MKKKYENEPFNCSHYELFVVQLITSACEGVCSADSYPTII